MEDILQHWLIRMLFIAPLLAAAYTDITRYRIPNALCLTMLALFPVALLAAPVKVPVLMHLATAAAVLGVGFILFIPGLLGGGDAKLMAVCGLWLGPAATLHALVLTTLSGGVLTLALLILRAIPGLGRVRVLARGGPIPYGLAICASGILVSGSLPMLGRIS